MRQYDELVEVRKGPVAGYGIDGPGAIDTLEGPVRWDGPADLGPQQFLWRGRLWQVRSILAHWVESGAWWVRRPEDQPGCSELICEREVWRVSAARGRAVATELDPGFGVFDLAFDPGRGVWRLAGSLD